MTLSHHIDFSFSIAPHDLCGLKEVREQNEKALMASMFQGALAAFITCRPKPPLFSVIACGLRPVCKACASETVAALG